jgi:hypothetical protein
MFELGLLSGFILGIFAAGLMRSNDNRLPDECVGRECWKK